MKNSGSQLMQPSAALKAAPFWRTASATTEKAYPTLRHDIDCDIAIVGGGITGLSAALSLSKNHDVVLLEQGSVAEGSSGFSAGILSLATTVDLRVVEEQFGRESAALLYSRLSAAVNRTLDAVCLGEDALQTGVSIYAAAKANHISILSTEEETRRRYGLTTKFHDRSGLPPFLKDFHGALELAGERAVNPVKLVQAIAERATEGGCRIFENTGVTQFDYSKGGADGVFVIRILDAQEDGVKRLHAVIQSRHTFKLPPVEHAWRASFSLPADGLPLVKQLNYGDNKLVVASTDGLPSGMLLGDVITNLIENRQDSLMEMLKHDRKPSLSARMLSLLPNVPTLRNTALKLVFFGMRLKDICS